MDGGRAGDRAEVVRELQQAADDFAERAAAQETLRDRARPGTGPHHQHAHSATLWRLAERTLRTRIEQLDEQRLTWPPSSGRRDVLVVPEHVVGVVAALDLGEPVVVVPVVRADPALVVVSHEVDVATLL